MRSLPRCQLFVGSETGLLKKINVESKSWCNVNSVSQVDKQKEIVALCWNNPDQTELCRALRNQTVVLTSGNESHLVDLKGGDGIFKGLDKIDEKYLTCTESGLLRLWGQDASVQLEKNVGPDVCCMKKSQTDNNLVITAGKENELKLWNLSKIDKSLFTAKNPSHDWLNLRKPVWILDAGFLPNSRNIVTTTSYHQIRLYDSNAQRRPVLDIEFGDAPITTLSCHPGGNQVVIGNSHGNMAMVDIRGKGHIVQKYKGSLGGVRQVVCHPSAEMIASCGLDRCVRLHDINSRALLHKFYLKSRLNCLLFQDLSSDLKLEVESSEMEMEPSHIKESSCRKEGCDNSGSDDDDNEDDDIWSNMTEVKTDKLKRKSKAQSTRDIKRARDECNANIIKSTKLNDAKQNNKEKKKKSKA